MSLWHCSSEQCSSCTPEDVVRGMHGSQVLPGACACTHHTTPSETSTPGLYTLHTCIRHVHGQLIQLLQHVTQMPMTHGRACCLSIMQVQG
jgi:hypothetical protein